MKTRWMIGFVLIAAFAVLAATGCKRKIDGPRMWWDDQARERLPDDYNLPEDRREGTERDPSRQNLEHYGLQSY